MASPRSDNRSTDSTMPGQAAGQAEVQAQAQALAQTLSARGWRMATAESCTGGLIAAACTDLAGSSQWFEGGWVSYSNQAKTQMLGVDAALIARHGAVSEAVALAMARGAAERAHAQAALAVTGVAGPGGGSASKPVGTVWFAWCVLGQAQAQVLRFDGDRAAVRAQTALHALRGLHGLLTRLA